MTPPTDERVKEQILRDLHEMAALTAVKGQLLRMMIDEILATRQALREAKEAIRIAICDSRASRANMARILGGDYEQRSSYKMLVEAEAQLTKLSALALALACDNALPVPPLGEK